MIKTQRIIDFGAIGLLTVFSLTMIIIMIVTLVDRDLEGNVECFKTYTEQEKLNDEKSKHYSLLQCPAYFATASRCCWRYSLMSILLCSTLIVVIYLIMRTSCVEKLCRCRR